MDRTRLAATAGIVACLAFVTVLAVPFGSPAVNAYYAYGALNPLIGGLLAIVTLIVFAAGRQERSDPALAAGVALALGLLITAIAGAWAVTARTDVASIVRLHRDALPIAGALIPLAATWYARELRLI